MINLKLDSDNNLIVGSKLITIDGVEAVAQDCRTRLGMLLGEYPFDTTQGMDYATLFNANNRNNLKNAIINELKKDERIEYVTINSLSVDSKGKATISIECRLYSGEVVSV